MSEAAEDSASTMPTAGEAESTAPDSTPMKSSTTSMPVSVRGPVNEDEDVEGEEEPEAEGSATAIASSPKKRVRKQKSGSARRSAKSSKKAKQDSNEDQDRHGDGEEDEPMDEDGNITDEDSTGPSDPLGDEKINSDGTLRGGRRYQIRTFTLPRYPNRLYMLTMDLSKCLGFRDSYLFYLRNPELKRINATAADKESLLERNLLAPVLKGRPLGIMTARSAFKLFGHAVIFGGRPVRDDYYCTGKEEPVQSGTTGQGHGEDSNALAKVNLNIKVVDKASSPALLRAAASASEFNALLAIQRRGKKFLDIHTNIDQVPLLTQPTTIVIEKSPDFALPPGDRHTMTVDLQAENEEDQQASDGMICMKIDEETARNYPIALTAGQYQAGYSVFRTRFAGEAEKPVVPKGPDAYLVDYFGNPIPIIVAPSAPGTLMPTPRPTVPQYSAPQTPHRTASLQPYPNPGGAQGTQLYATSSTGLQSPQMISRGAVGYPMSPYPAISAHSPFIGQGMMATPFRPPIQAGSGAAGNAKDAPPVSMGPSGKYTVRFTCAEVTKAGKRCQKPVTEAGLVCLYHQRARAAEAEAAMFAMQYPGVPFPGSANFPGIAATPAAATATPQPSQAQPATPRLASYPQVMPGSSMSPGMTTGSLPGSPLFSNSSLFQSGMGVIPSPLFRPASPGFPSMYGRPSPSKATGAKIGRPRIHPLPPNKGAKASPNPTASNLTTATNHGAVAVGPASQPPRPAPPPRPPTPDPNACCLCESVPPPAKLPDGTRGRPNADPPSLLACAKCKLKHHPFCADIRTPVMVAKTRQYKWCCGNCKVCDKCGKAGEDERLMVLCDACDRGYHTYCLDPPLKEPPSGTWHCPSCATCISCGRHQTPSSKWFQATFPPEQEDFAVTGDVEIYAATYCAPCGKLYENKSYCPLCFHVYHEDAEDLEMACCDECDRWIHVNCDPLLTDALYRRLTTQSSTPYTCALCDPSRLDVLIAKRTKETSTKKSGLGGGEVFRRIETGGKVVVIPPLVERKEDVVPKG